MGASFCAGRGQRPAAGGAHGHLRWAIAAATGYVLLVGPVASGKKVEGFVRLAPNQSKVVTKFCVDFNTAAACKDKDHCKGMEPGLVRADVWAGHRIGGSATSKDTALPAGRPKAPPELSFVLLDDQYNSFPEVAPVWNEATCEDIMKASRSHMPMSWENVVQPKPSNATQLTKTIVEKIRPRWWYVAFVSCSSSTLEFSWSVHMENPLQGSQSEFSMDVINVVWFAFLFSILFSCVAYYQVLSARAWLYEGAASKGASWLRLHPAMLILTGATTFATLGMLVWAQYYRVYMSSGEASDRLALVARGGVVGGKTLVSILLLLFAHGQCVCSPDISWSEHKELIGGLLFFGIFSFGLETWSDSEMRSTTTEYVYDTRPGMLSVGLDLLYLWLYTTRCWRTYQAETRLKPKVWYKRYGAPLALWFAALPVVAILGQLLDPWVRFRITFVVNGFVHAIALGVLVYTFQPHLAGKLYELSTHEYQPVSAEELDKFLAEDDDDI